MRVIPAAWQRGIALGVLLVGAGVPLGAQQAPPNPLGQPLLDAAGQLRDDAFIRIPLRPEDERYADIEGDHLKAMLLEVDAISLADRDAGTVFWGRNVGTAGHVATQDWVEELFRRNGLDNIYRQSFDLQPIWQPTAWAHLPSLARTGAGRSQQATSSACGWHLWLVASCVRAICGIAAAGVAAGTLSWLNSSCWLGTASTTSPPRNP